MRYVPYNNGTCRAAGSLRWASMSSERRRAPCRLALSCALATSPSPREQHCEGTAASHPVTHTQIRKSNKTGRTNTTTAVHRSVKKNQAGY
eukprot:scaffold43527_cov35-Prasinocladus_malaysianus.AAC.2